MKREGREERESRETEGEEAPRYMGEERERERGCRGEIRVDCIERGKKKEKPVGFSNNLCPF